MLFVTFKALNCVIENTMDFGTCINNIEVRNVCDERSDESKVVSYSGAWYTAVASLLIFLIQSHPFRNCFAHSSPLCSSHFVSLRTSS